MTALTHSDTPSRSGTLTSTLTNLPDRSKGCDAMPSWNPDEKPDAQVERVHQPDYVGRSPTAMRRVCAVCRVPWPCLAAQEIAAKTAGMRGPWWYIPPRTPG